MCNFVFENKAQLGADVPVISSARSNHLSYYIDTTTSHQLDGRKTENVIVSVVIVFA